MVAALSSPQSPGRGAGVRSPSSTDLTLAVHLGSYSFSSLYSRAQNPEWSDYYVDYVRLEEELTSLRKRLRRDERESRKRRDGSGRRGRRRSSSIVGGPGKRKGRSPPRLGHRRYRSSQALPGLSSPEEGGTAAADADSDAVAGKAWAEAAREMQAEMDSEAAAPPMGAVTSPSLGVGMSLEVDRLRSPPLSSTSCGGGAGASAEDTDDNAGVSAGRRSASFDWTHWSPPDFLRGRKATADGSVGAHSASTAGAGAGGWVEPGSDQEAFVRLLDAEVERSVLFLLAETGRVAECLSGLLSASSSVNADGEGGDNVRRIEQYRPAAARLAELYLFAAANLTAVRKVLDSHDDVVQALPGGAPLARWYFRTRGRRGEHSGGGGGGGARSMPMLKAAAGSATLPPPSHLESLLSRDGLESARSSLLRGVEIEAGRRWLAASGGRGGAESIDFSGEVFASIRRSDPALANVDAVAERLKKAEHGSVKDFVVLGSIGNTLALEPAVVSEKIGENDLDLAFYASQRERLLQGVVMGDTGLAPYGIGGQGGLVGAEIQLDGRLKESAWIDYYLPLSLNLFSTFLYMVNYFIAGPTSAVYIETLGGNKALAGMVIGATPWAAMVSAVLFSVWTNWNFKSPLLFSGACLCVGNLLYGIAYKFDSIALVMLGRVATGLGGPRVINRRYIADICPLESRTAISAAFVTLSAAGVAVGPGLSALLQSVNFRFIAPLFGEVEVNGLTAPGYLMFLVWLTFALTLLATFHEPERMGLQQLQDKETLMYPSDGVEENGTGGPAAAVDERNGHIKETEKGEAGDNISTEGDGYGHYISTVNQEHDEETGGREHSDAEGETQALLQHNPIQGNANYSATKPDAEEDKGGHCVKEAGEETSAETGTDPDLPSSSSVTSRNVCCLRRFNLQVWICIILLFVDKFAQEAVMSAAPIITGHRYGWSVEMIGALGVAIGALVVPLSICVGWLSRRFEDRVILRWLLFVALIGLMVLVDGKELLQPSVAETHNAGNSIFGVGPRRYICGSLIAFSGLQCMESVIMSALSKVVPHSLAVGVCNSGLINTETGTLGRAMGDVAVTLAGFVSLHGMLNTLMIPLVLVILGCIVMVQMNYRILAV